MTEGDRDKLRAELAGKAMQGLVANDRWLQAVLQKCPGDEAYKTVADASVAMADALMAELGIKGEE